MSNYQRVYLFFSAGAKLHRGQGLGPERVEMEDWLAVFADVYIVWVNYNDLTATSLGIMVNKGNHSQMALFQVSELL